MGWLPAQAWSITSTAHDTSLGSKAADILGFDVLLSQDATGFYLKVKRAFLGVIYGAVCAHR
jgi:hypothetical protein